MKYKCSDVKCSIPEEVKEILRAKTLEEQISCYKLYQCRGKLFTLTGQWHHCHEADFVDTFIEKELQLFDYYLLLQDGFIVGVEINDEALFCFKSDEGRNLSQIMMIDRDFWPEHKYEVIWGKWYYFCFGNYEKNFHGDNWSGKGNLWCKED